MAYTWVDTARCASVTMEDISDTTHDEYGQRATGVPSSLDKFDSVLGLKLG